MFLNETSCNLTSLNLMQFASPRDVLDVQGFKTAVKVIITAMEILVGYADYPTEGIDRATKKFRPLGIGYANLGALLMSRGLPYDSNEGRELAACITSIMNGVAYAQSARVAAVVGPFEGYEANRDPMLRVIEKHRAAALRLATGDMESAPSWQKEAVACWNDALRLGKKYGYRNSQVGVLAPTGTISFMMDCDTTGIEPDTALVKYKKMVGEGLIKIVNQGVPAALRNLGYSDNQVQAILHDLDSRGTVEGSPTLKAEHLPVFDCAITPASGTRSIAWRGHVAMMSAVQPFISGAISKTVNMPNEATVDDVADAYMEAWKTGFNAI
jgi:ribonucleoside-diphosphate reductase alpha chain